ncbi:DUF2512 family protein [Brevibacillus centrosporus]|uniref:DUF2512 family protein n=1 Tax=Brevibacillus centrosporus TaxID=54910 RepID=UPI000F09FF97|nr:DUF2512 family protein [Brevibacillus centrosporus]MEC2128272.1 DUF2512 family protein [Brevibacillus centrosporus]RNB73874.1 DUF2512 family protein [Brevibacillus centrosporus]GED30733.1 hypothetical protein BCE02nite_18740 [Brevibacillus centrosporus]
MNILIKLLVNGIIAVPGLWWSGTSLTFAVLTSIVVSLIAYALGDALILPKTNNTFATTADFIMVFALFWISSYVFAQPYHLPGILLTAFVVTVAEYFFHSYLQHHGVHHSKHPG